MSKFTVPSSLDSAKTSLTEIGRLINAKKWERAAIVAAYVTTDNPPGRGNRSVLTDFLSPLQFAEFGITGLSSKTTVQRYVETWLAHRPRPRRGEIVDLTGLPEWPAAGQTGGRPRDSKAEDAATIIERRGAAEVVNTMTRRQRDGMATELRRRQAEDAAARADQIAQEQLHGVDGRESAALRDQAEAHLHLVQRLLEASYTITVVVGEWRRYRGFLTPGDMQEVGQHLDQIQANLDIMRMNTTDDVVGEVLNHEGR